MEYDEIVRLGQLENHDDDLGDQVVDGNFKVIEVIELHSLIFLLDFIQNEKSLEKIEIMHKTRKVNLKKLYAAQAYHLASEAVCVDNSDAVEPDYYLREETEDPSIEVTEENREAAEISKSRALDAILEDNLNEAVEHLTEATESKISYILHVSRGDDAALEVNPDLANGYKARGMTKALLGLWDHYDAEKGCSQCEEASRAEVILILIVA